MTLMRRGIKLTLCAPIVVLGLTASTPASAAAFGALSSVGAIDKTEASQVIKVQRRGNRRRRAANRANRRAAQQQAAAAQHASNRRRARRKRRQKVLLGIGLGILGAAVLANRHYDRPRSHSHSSYAYGDGGYRAAKRRCARHFEDYDWRTDMVYDYYGDERLCPYVRKYY